MASSPPGANDHLLSPEEMRKWAKQELQDIAKAGELRTREVTQLQTAYSAGELSAREAYELRARYEERWDEALPGASMSDGVSDAQILATIDEARRQVREARMRTTTQKGWTR